VFLFIQANYKTPGTYLMKHVLLILFFILSLNEATGKQTKVLTEIDSFGVNPGNLKMYVYGNIPNSTNKIPVVVVLHGCGGNAKAISELTGLNKLAAIHEFLVIYPQQKLMNNPIDTSRIFITGVSAGAAMSVVMAATHPELFKCGAFFAGGAYKIASDAVNGLKGMRGTKYFQQKKLVKDVGDQNPNYKGEYPNMIIYQGLNDGVVNKKNALFLVNQWTGVNNTNTIADVVEPAFMHIDDITRTEYRDTLGRTPVILYEVKKLGHKLLIKPGDKENEGGKKGIFGVDKGFHSTYQTAKEFGILKKNQ